MKIELVPPTGSPDIKITLSFDEYLTLRLLQHCNLGGIHSTRHPIQKAFEEADEVLEIDVRELMKRERNRRLGRA